MIMKEDGLPVGRDSVTLSAIPLHAMFNQIDMYLNHENIAEASSLYPFKAYLSKLLLSSTTSKHVQSQCELFVTDGNDDLLMSNNMEAVDPNPQIEKPKGTFTPDSARLNVGLNHRHMFTEGGRVVDLESTLVCDICTQDRYILNGVDMRLRLFPSQNTFRLMANSRIRYYVKITEVYLRVPKITVAPEVILAHNEILQHKPAVYPHYKSSLKTFNVPEGQYTFTVENPFQSGVPAKVFICFVSSESFNGKYTKNPFNFKHYDVKSCGYFIDGVSHPNQPMETDFAHRDVILAYKALLDTCGRTDQDTNFDIDLKRFMDGYTILAFNLEASVSDTLDYWSKAKVGHSRLEIKFGSPLPEPINIIAMGIFPQILYIDKTRNVSTGAQ